MGNKTGTFGTAKASIGKDHKLTKAFKKKDRTKKLRQPKFQRNLAQKAVRKVGIKDAYETTHY